MIRFVQNEWHFYGVKNFVCREIGLVFRIFITKNVKKKYDSKRGSSNEFVNMRERKRSISGATVNCNMISKNIYVEKSFEIKFQKSYNLILSRKLKKACPTNLLSDQKISNQRELCITTQTIL